MEPKTGSEKLVDHVLESMDYGQMITHTEISIIMSIKEKSHKYRTEVTKANRTLIEKGKMLKSRPGTGYIVLEPDRYIDEAQLKFKHGANRAEQAFSIFAFAPVSLMSPEAKETYHIVESGVKHAVAMVIGGLKEIKLLNRKNISIQTN